MSRCTVLRLARTMIAEKRHPQSAIGPLLALIVVVAVLCGGLVHLRNTSEVDDETGPVESYPEFPEPLQELLNDADETQISADPVEVYCVEHFIDETYFWQMRASPELIDLAAEHWKLLPLDENDGSVRLFWNTFPSAWSVPPRSNESEFFINAGWLDNTQCVLFVVMHDKTDQRLFVLYRWVF
jgi:hypothetical protein